MQKPGRIYPGSIPRIVVDFVDPSGVAGDPATVTFSVQSPSCAVSTYVNGADSAVSNPQVGRYILAIPSTVIDRGGRWRWRVVTTGATYAYEGDVVIQYSPFVDANNWGDYPL